MDPMNTYSPEDFLKDIPTKLLAIPEGRIELTKYDPMLFALLYMPHHLKDQQTQQITLSEFHVKVAEYGLTWVKRDVKPMEIRDAFIAPRGVGKSTWIFTILPMWAAAHGHVKFLMAFSDAADQAEGHLNTFKLELQSNSYLNSDFPELCEPLKQGNRPVAWSANRIALKNGFVFDARGIDTNSLGKKWFTTRPDLIILDDIERGEKNYSEYQASQQKNTVFDDIAPMNLNARMVFVGTTTMPNSVMDQFRKYAEGYDDGELKWIDEQNVKVHYFPAILASDDGTERSIWPDKWSMEFLQSRRHTRDFAKNYMNRPMATDGQFWGEADVIIDGELEEFGNTILSVDPAVTKGKVSDYTGLAVLSRATSADGKSRIYVRHAEQMKGSPEQLAARVLYLCEQFDVGVLYVEVNQGGDLWKSVFKDIPAKYRSKHQKVSKEVRAGKVLNHYQQDKVRHTERFPVLEEQMLSFPKLRHEDVLDAVMSGVLYFAESAAPISARQLNYKEMINR
jgi:hypothetical protein